MTRSIKLHSMLMNWMCFPLQVWGGFAPPAKSQGVWGAAPPSQNLFRKNEKSKKRKTRNLLNTLTVSKRHYMRVCAMLHLCYMPLRRVGNDHWCGVVMIFIPSKALAIPFTSTAIMAAFDWLGRLLFFVRSQFSKKSDLK